MTVTLQAGEYSHIKEVPISMLEEPLNTKLLYQGVHDGIKVLESMALKSDKNDSPLIRVDLPLEMIPYIQPAASRLYRSNTSIQVIGAMITSNANIIIQIASTVRSKLLVCMELADQFGYDIEIESFNEKQTINNHFVTNYIKNEITNNGDGNITNTGNDSNSITIRFSVSLNAASAIPNTRQTLSWKGTPSNCIKYHAPSGITRPKSLGIV